MEAMSVAQMPALTKEKLKACTPDQIKALIQQDINALETAPLQIVLPNLDPAQIAQFRPKHL